MRKLSVLLTLLLVALCANVSYAWDFWKGDDISYLGFKHDGDKHEMTKTTASNGGALWTYEFTATETTMKWKWVVSNNEGQTYEYSAARTITAGDTWTKIENYGTENGDNTLNGLEVGAKYIVSIKAESETLKGTALINVCKAGEEPTPSQVTIYITGENVGADTWSENTSSTLTSLGNGKYVWTFTATEKQPIFKLSTAVGSWNDFNGNALGIGKENQENYNLAVGSSAAYTKGYLGNIAITGTISGTEYRVIVDYLSSTIAVEKNTPQTTWTIDVTCPNAYDGFTFGNLEVFVNGEWKSVTGKEYTGETAPTAFRYEKVTLSSPYNDGDVYAKNFVWEGSLTTEDATLKGAVADLHKANFKFNDNAEGTFGQPKEVTVTANGNTLVAKEVTATRVANAWDYTVMTNRTSLDGAQVTFISSNDRHEDVSGALSDGAVFNAPELVIPVTNIYITGTNVGAGENFDSNTSYTLTSLGNGKYEWKFTASDNAPTFKISTTKGSWDNFNAGVLGIGSDATTVEVGSTSTYTVGNKGDIKVSGTTKGTEYRVIVDYQSNGENSGTITIEEIKDYSAVNMPLKEADFAGGKKHYFLVGSRMGGWRLQPEWEFSVEGKQAVLNERLMYPGAFAVAVVDSYDDYVHHKYTLFTSKNAGGNGNTFKKDNSSYSLSNDGSASCIIYKGNTMPDNNRWKFHIWSGYVADGGHIGMFWDWDDLGKNNNGGDIEAIRNAIKTGNPAFVPSFTLTLDASGNPTAVAANNVKSAVTERNEVVNELNFTLVGSNVRNLREEDGKAVFDRNHTPLAEVGVVAWGNAWVQYDTETKTPYIDGNGEYLYQTVYQSNWLQDHPSEFYRKAEEYEYNSNSVRLRPLSELIEEGSDEYIPYYQSLLSATLGDEVKKSGTENTLVWNYKDFMNRGNAVTAPDGSEWIPFVASDVLFGGQFKVWTGFGGGHLGYGTWDASVSGGTAFMWNVINGGASEKGDRLQIEAGNINVPENKVDDKAYMVRLYRVAKDVEDANYQASEVDDAGNAPMRYYKRLILWYNPVKGIDGSVFQAILGDYEGQIRATHDTQDSKTAAIKWFTVLDKAVDDVTVAGVTITRYKNGEKTGVTIPVELKDGVKFSELTEAEQGAIEYKDNNLSAGVYTYELLIDLGEEYGTRSVMSNPVTIYEAGIPLNLEAVQHEADGKIAFQVDVTASVKASVEATNTSDFNADMIENYLLSYREAGSDSWSELVSVEYVKGESVKYSFAALPGKTYEVQAEIAGTWSEGVIDFIPAVSEVEVLMPKTTVSVKTSIEKVSDTETAFDEVHQMHADSPEHKGASELYPAHYHYANYVKAVGEVSDNWMPVENESVEFQLSADYAEEAVAVEREFAVDYLPVNAEGCAAAEFAVTAVYKRGEEVIATAPVVKASVSEDVDAKISAPALNAINDTKVVGGRYHGDGSGQGTINHFMEIYSLHVEFVPVVGVDSKPEDDDVYHVHGFAVTDNYREYDDDHHLFGDFDNPDGATAPYVTAKDENLTFGCADYTYYDGSNWSIENDWSSLIKNHSFGILLHHVACRAYGDKSAVTLKENVDFTFYNYFPFIESSEIVVEKTAAAEYAPARVARAASATTLRLLEKAGSPVSLAPTSYALDNVITGVENVAVGAEKPVDVYTVSGALIMRGTTKAEAVKTLAPGIYVIGNEKVVVK